jgi:hypothetical protein
MQHHSRKAALLAGLLGGMALAGAGVAHAVGDEPPLQCSQDARGNVVCKRYIERTWTTDDGSKVSVEQTMDCTSAARNRQYGPVGDLAHKDGHQGASVDCSPQAPR